MTVRTSAACALILCATQAPAVELTGGSLTFAYSAFVDETSFDRTDIRGQTEFGFSRGFSTQLDIAAYRFGQIDRTGTNVTVHAIYHVSDATSLGAFFSRDDVLDGHADLYGLQAGFDFSDDLAGEAYLSTGDNEGVDGNLLGFDLGYQLNERVGLNLGLDHADFDFGADLTRISVGAEYATGEAGRVFAEIGSLRAEAFELSGSDEYIGLGYRIDFGAERGATFGERGLLRMLPGL